MWSLTNAFTSAFKELDPIPAYKATAKLGPFDLSGCRNAHSSPRVAGLIPCPFFVSCPFPALASDANASLSSEVYVPSS
jgi:hypothetical protein